MQQLVRPLLALLLIDLAASGAASAAGRRIATSDVIQIRVLNQADLDNQARVAPDGTINFPYVGRIRAAGLSEDALAERIKAALAKGDVVKNAEVVISVVTFGTQISVQGAVGLPGQYPLDRPTTLTQALARAGGLSKNAGTVILRRHDGRGLAVTRFDAKAILDGNPNVLNTVVQNSDDIYVEEAPVYYLAGYVQKPGEYPLVRKLTVHQALAAGGGIAELGSTWFIQIKRRQVDGRFVVESASLDDEVQPSDIVIVNERIF
jgi:polysaccharide export outer membrane protein